MGDIGQQAEDVLPVLRAAALTDPEALVRRDAAEALGSFGASVIPDLMKALNDQDWQVRSGALGGLGKVTLQRPEFVLPLLEQGLHDRNEVIRRSAAIALGMSGSKAAYITLMTATNVPGIGDVIYQTRSNQHLDDLK